jgi:hypothetical protein
MITRHRSRPLKHSFATQRARECEQVLRLASLRASAQAKREGGTTAGMWPFASCAPAEEPQPQAKTLEEGLAAAEKYEGDPLECPCIAHMKEGPCGGKFVVA